MPWDQVDDYMHLPRQFVPEEEKRSPADGRSYETQGQSFVAQVRRQQSSGKTGWEFSGEAQVVGNDCRTDAVDGKIHVQKPQKTSIPCISFILPPPA